ncbi:MULTISPECIES: hypothetical protein [Paenibacillus]|jgi:hypothetical protein|uniref:Uncharacterized protein n=1 Tax=Paenibacillus oceani TaxID=2772510 RepID=A0A927GZB6_9BACL|nr:hypothetical protein [Paenibacillus oceani]MBD2862475.1 hypothetical protein [Paenibacillus oceani]
MNPKKLLSLSFLVCLMVFLSTSVYAQQVDVPKALEQSERSKAFAYLNSEINKENEKRAGKIVLNQAKTETYSYTHEDGSVTSVNLNSITVRKQDEDKVRVNSDGTYSLLAPLTENTTDASLLAIEDVITYQNGSTSGNRSNLIYYAQTVYGKWEYQRNTTTGFGVTGSMKTPSHTAPVSVSCAPSCTAGTPAPFTLLVEPSKSAGHVGGNTQLTFLAGGGGTLSFITRIIMDVNGNYNILSS